MSNEYKLLTRNALLRNAQKCIESADSMATPEWTHAKVAIAHAYMNLARIVP